MTTTAAAPLYIARDTYAGRHTAQVKSFISSVFANVRAGDIAAQAPTGIIWESFGTPRGFKHEYVGRSRYVADRDGNLMMFSSDGGLTLIHSADRMLRVLVKAA